MATILQSLKVSNVRRASVQTPNQVRRLKLVKSILEQCEAVNAALKGEKYKVKALRRVKNAETGDSILIEHVKRFRPCWWKAEDGKHYIEVRYGWKPLEISKGKTTVEVGDAANLIPTLEILRDAVLVGEFDEQLAAVATKIRVKKAADKS